MILGKKGNITVRGHGTKKIVMRPLAKAEIVLRRGLRMTIKRYKTRRMLRHPMIKRGG